MSCMYELIVVWDTGETDFYEYLTQDEAEEAGKGMKTAFGNQITWFGTRKKVRL